jgi:hypothetical protein
MTASTPPIFAIRARRFLLGANELARNGAAGGAGGSHHRLRRHSARCATVHPDVDAVV